MGIRLKGFDYKRPYFYMVTLKRAQGFSDFARVVDDPASHYLEPNAITRIFVDIIKTFHNTWYCIEPITCFAIMPDHIHLLIKIRDVEKRVSLAVIVRMLMRALEKGVMRWRAEQRWMHSLTEQRFAQLLEVEERHLFEFDWHDWIVARDGQLAAFTRYIRENAERSWLRKSHREYFQRVNEIEFLGRKWYGYGNAALLKLPVIEPFRCSRKWVEGGAEWQEAIARAERIGPGGAGLSTFMSPCEKACGHAIGTSGGRWIVLSPEGFGERWHPGRQYEKFCAEGRMLFISLWPAMTREPTNAELYQRCHEMGDLVVERLAKS
jgi:REP element-mobilizing transposase RayT